MKRYSDKDCAEIRDLGFASALVAIGCPVVSYRRELSGRVHFVFKKTDDFTSAAQAWHDYELDVNARIYFRTIKQLKDIIYGERFS